MILSKNLKSKNKLKEIKQSHSRYILCTIHRRENISSKDNLSSIFSSLDLINKHIKIVMPLHPHTKKIR